MSAVLEKPEVEAIDSEHMPPRWKWTRKQYYDLAEKGYFAGKRVELIEGEIVYTPAVNYPHTAALEYTSNKLKAIFGAKFWVRPQMPIQCGKSEPEPDLAVISGGPADYTDEPTSTLLIVEISDSTFSYDSKVKSLVYAKAGNPEYWVLDLRRSRLIVFRDPSKKGYKLQTILNRTESVRALAAPQVPIKVSDLLP